MVSVAHAVVLSCWCPCCSFVVLVLCFGDGATETPAESPVDAEIAEESDVPADENYFPIGLPKIRVLFFR